MTDLYQVRREAQAGFDKLLMNSALVRAIVMEGEQVGLEMRVILQRVVIALHKQVEQLQAADSERLFKEVMRAERVLNLSRPKPGEACSEPSS